MYILSINPIAQPGLLWTIGSFPFYVAGGLFGGVKRALVGNPAQNIEHLNRAAASISSETPIGSRAYNALHRIIGSFGSDGRAKIGAATGIGTPFKNTSLSFMDRFMGTVGKLKGSGNVMMLLGIVAAIGLVGYGIGGIFSGVKDYDQVCHGQGTHLVKNRFYHLGLAALSAVMVGSVFLIPIVGLSALGVGLTAGAVAIALNSRFVQRHLGGMGIFRRPSDYIPGDIGIALHRAVDSRYNPM